MNNIAEVLRINEKELLAGITGTSGSWHEEFSSSSWCYVGGLDPRLTEGDLICLMSEWGEVEDVNLCRDQDTGKSKGFGFAKYEDFRSAVLAVDNGGGMNVLGRTLRVDHAKDYKAPKKKEEDLGKEDDMGGVYGPGGEGGGG
ncbi:hypothetical protein TrRE_jg146, partial [Triparma retinervis]